MVKFTIIHKDPLSANPIESDRSINNQVESKPNWWQKYQSNGLDFPPHMTDWDGAPTPYTRSNAIDQPHTISVEKHETLGAVLTNWVEERAFRPPFLFTRAPQMDQHISGLSLPCFPNLTLPLVGETFKTTESLGMKLTSRCLRYTYEHCLS